MKKRNYISGATWGQAFEEKFDSWLNTAKIEFHTDKTLTNSKRRRKDIKCDRRLVIDNKDIFFELKSTTSKEGLGFKLYDDGRDYNIKFHQICKMDYLVIEYRDKETYLITKQQFLAWACSVKKNSIAYKDAVKIGKVITDMEWINGV